MGGVGEVMTDKRGLVSRRWVLLAWVGLWLMLCTAAVRGGEGALLYEISAEGVPPCYLFGTIHSEDPRVLALSPTIQEAFDRSPVFILETLLDAQAMARSLRIMAYEDGRDLAQVAGAARYGRLVEAMAGRGLP